jgi:hypothetical protein
MGNLCGREPATQEQEEKFEQEVQHCRRVILNTYLMASTLNVTYHGGWHYNTITYTYPNNLELVTFEDWLRLLRSEVKGTIGQHRNLRLLGNKNYPHQVVVSYETQARSHATQL